MIGSRKSHWKMRSLTSSPVLTAQAPVEVSFDVTSLIENIHVNLSSSLNLTLRYIFVMVAYCTRPRPMHNGFILFILCSLLTMAIAATDCEILNSGIPSISSTACCTETTGIVCVNDRVTEM
jgi:hypothetical protein